MDENLHDIENLFHSALNDNEETPSENVWEDIDKRLDKESVILIKRKYTNLKRVAGFLLLLLLGFIVHEVNTSHTNKGLAENTGNAPANKINESRQTDLTIHEKSSTHSSAANENKNADDGIKENTVVLTADDNSKPSYQKSVNHSAEHKQSAVNNIHEKLIREKEFAENQPDLTYGKKNKKLTGKRSYNVTIENAMDIADNDGPETEPIMPSVQKQNIIENEIENVVSAEKGSADPKKKNEPASVVKQTVSDTSFTTVAKTIQKKQKKLSGFSITPFFSPDIAWHHIVDDRRAIQTGNAMLIRKLEKREFAYTFGTLVDYKLNRHWGFQSGITLSVADISVLPESIFAEPDKTGKVKYRVNTSSGYGYILPAFSNNPSVGDSLTTISSEHVLNYIGIPLAVKYSIEKGRFTLNVMGGLVFNILTRAKLEIELENGTGPQKETLNNLYGINKTYISGMAGIGVDYKLNNRTSLVFAPTMRFALNSINKDATVETYPMSLGFIGGLKIRL